MTLNDQILAVIGTKTRTVTQVADAIAATDVTGERAAVRDALSALVKAGTLVRINNRFVTLKGTP